MSSGASIGISNGTAGAQGSVEQMTSEMVAKNNEEILNHQNHLINELPKGSPIRIPQNAAINEEHKNGYDQVKYTWNEGEYSYTSRWHTKTPNAPNDQESSWVVERKKAGVGHGKNARPKKEEVLVGKNEWISKQDWKDAIIARKKGTLTQKQKEWLDNGHWESKR